MAAKKSSRRPNASSNGNTATISNRKKKKNRAMTISHHLSKTMATSTTSETAHHRTTTTSRMELFDCFVECLTTSDTSDTKRLSEEVNESDFMKSALTQASSPAAILLADEERRFVQRFDELNRQLDKLRSLQSDINELNPSSELKSRKVNAYKTEDDHYEQFLDQASQLNKKFDVEMSYLTIWHENQKKFVQEQFEQECRYLGDEFEKKKSELKEKLSSETLERRHQLKIDIDLMDLSQVNSAMTTNVVNGISVAHGPNLNQSNLIRRKLRRRTNQKQSQAQLAQQSGSN